MALVAVSAMLVGCCGDDAPALPAPISVESTAWQVGEAVTLTVHTAPPRPGAPVSLTVLAPGTGEPDLLGAKPGFFGISGVQLLWLEGEYEETEMALAAASGARTIGLDFDWRRIEPEPGAFDWEETDEAVALAKRYGLRLVPMLLYTPRWASTVSFAPLDYHRAPPEEMEDYRDFVYAVVNRYKPYGASPLTSDGYGIRDWVMWNEPNVRPGRNAPAPGEFWTGSLEAYVKLLRAGYEGAHAADPGCNVLNGALADVYWAEGEQDLLTALERLYDPNGDGDTGDGARPFFDTLNVHTYQPGAPDAAWYEQRLDRILQVMKRFGDEEKSIWITETGYGTAGDPPPGSPYVSEAAQANGVRTAYEVCSRYPRVERVFWWSLRDYHSDASANNRAMEAHYGLLRSNFAPKRGYVTYAQLTGRVGDVLTLNPVMDGEGGARAVVPGSFVAREGTYVVFAELDRTTQAAVVSYAVGSEGEAIAE